MHQVLAQQCSWHLQHVRQARKHSIIVPAPDAGFMAEALQKADLPHLQCYTSTVDLSLSHEVMAILELLLPCGIRQSSWILHTTATSCGPSDRDIQGAWLRGADSEACAHETAERKAAVADLSNELVPEWQSCDCRGFCFNEVGKGSVAEQNFPSWSRRVHQQQGSPVSLSHSLSPAET